MRCEKKASSRIHRWGNLCEPPAFVFFSSTPKLSAANTWMAWGEWGSLFWMTSGIPAGTTCHTHKWTDGMSLVLDMWSANEMRPMAAIMNNQLQTANEIPYSGKETQGQKRWTTAGVLTRLFCRALMWKLDADESINQIGFNSPCSPLQMIA